jgi:hypothetical protein
MANTTISALANTVAVADLTSNDFIVVDNAVAATTKKLAVQDLKRLTLTSVGTGLNFIKDITSGTLRSRSLAAGSNKVTVTNNSDTLEVDIAEAQIDLSNCNNSTSAFLSTVNATTNITAGTLPVTRGGTGVSTLTDKSILATQLSGTDGLRELTMATNGQLIIGGTSGPQVATLTAGTNTSITNTDGGITINNTYSIPSTYIQTNDNAVLGDISVTGLSTSSSGAVTQTGSLAGGVTLNAVGGTITLFASAITSNTNTQFTVVNNQVSSTSVIFLSREFQSSVAANNGVHISLASVSNGSFVINITHTGNHDAGSIVRKIHFFVLG